MDTLEQLNAKIEEMLTRFPETRPLYERMNKMTDRELEEMAAEALLATLLGLIDTQQLRLLADMTLIISVHRDAVRKEQSGRVIH